MRRRAAPPTNRRFASSPVRQFPGSPAHPAPVGFRAMRFGMHLPHTGRASSSAAITRVARLAEALGFHDVWVSDHLVSPVGQDFPTPYIYDPLLSLAWAAAATTT